MEESGWNSKDQNAHMDADTKAQAQAVSVGNKDSIGQLDQGLFYAPSFCLCPMTFQVAEIKGGGPI